MSSAPTPDILMDLVLDVKRPPGLHLGATLAAHGVDRVDASMWTRVGSRATNGIAREWYLTLRTYVRLRYLVDLDDFNGDGAFELALSYEANAVAHHLSRPGPQPLASMR
jgi:hypothetical protein